MRVLAVIPAREGSKRLPGKNTRQLFNKPLIAWTIEFAKSIPWFTDIEVSTESEEIAAVGASHGIQIRRLRPTKLASDEATSIDVVLDVLHWKRSSNQEFDAVALLQPTTPVRFMQRWDAAYDLLKRGDCDGVIGVSLADTHPYNLFRNSVDGYLESWVANPANVTRSQDYPPAYAVNGSLYLITVESLIEQRTFFPIKCRPVLCLENVENIDIDTSFDWHVAEMLIADWLAKR